MRNLFLLMVLTASAHVYGQAYTVTPDGLRDKSDNEKTYLVLEADGLSATQLYDNAIKYVNEKYKDPEEVIKGKTEGEYLKFDTHISNFIVYNNSGAKMPIQATYTTELRFKEGKVKYEIVSLEMKAKTANYYVLFTGGLLEGYIIYKKNGKLFKEEAKTDIENHFNIYVFDLLKFLQGDNNSDSDW